MGDFLMPSLGADMESGTIAEWRVAPGDVVARGDIVAVVETDKSDIEVEVFEAGTIEELLVEEGREVAVGTPLARIAAAGPPPEAIPGSEASTEAASLDETAAASHVRSSPRARKLAAERGVDLESVRGSGPDGAVVAADLDAAVDTSTAAPASETASVGVAESDRRTDRQAALRRAVGELMARSKREIPHYYVATTIDLAVATAWLEEKNALRPITERVLPAALLLKAAALAAGQVPGVNGFWNEGFAPSTEVHLGVAVALRGGGLVAPAIHEADRLTLDELMAALRDVVERARAGRLRSSEMSDPTITVTNLGDQGAEEVYPVIYPPQVAIAGFGRVVDRACAVDGMLAVHPTVRATLAADHRVTGGHEGSRFLAVIDRLLQDPEAL